MQEFFGYNEFEERSARESAKEFERMLSGDSFYFIDMVKVDEIFHFYLRNHHLGKAQRLIRFAQDNHAANPELFHKQARLDFEYGRFEPALRNINEALDHAPTQLEYSLLKADVLAQLDRYDEAIETLEDVLFVGSQTEDLYLQMGNIAQICSRPKESERYYRKALTLVPGFEEALYELVFLMESEQRLEEGIQLYEGFLDQYPFSSNTWYQLGNLYRKVGNYEKGILAFEYAISLDDEHQGAWFQMGELYAANNQHQLAIKAYFHARDLIPYDPYTYFRLGESYEQLGHYPEAGNYFFRAAELDADYIDAWMGVGYCLEKRERFLEATHYYQKAFDLDDESSDVCLSLAVCELKLGNEQKAYFYLDRTLNLNGEDMSIWQDWAQLLYEQSNYIGAVTFLEEGIKRLPRSVELYYQCAAYAFEAGMMKRGKNMLENALIVDSGRHYLLFHYFPGLKFNAEVKKLIAFYTT